MSSPEANLFAKKIGIVTRISKRYIYVWDNNLGIDELRFPVKSMIGAASGDLVYYRKQENVKGVQHQNDIEPFTEVRTQVVFPPPNYSPYVKRIKACERCHAIAWSADFHEVVAFAGVIDDYELNAVYEVDVCRLPTNPNLEEDPNKLLIETVGTLFCIVKNNTQMKVVYDNDELLRLAPWNKTSVELDEDFMIVLNTDSCSQSHGMHYKRYVNKQPLMSDDYHGSTVKQTMERQLEKIIDFDTSSPPSLPSATQHTLDMANFIDFESHRYALGLSSPLMREPQQSEVFLDEGCGLIVRLAAKYAVIWSARHNLVCAYGPAGVDRPLGTWVAYKCREDPDLRVESDYLTKSAYDLRDIQPRRESYRFDKTVKCQAKVRLKSRSFDDPKFMKTIDDEFGVVLCSRDPFLIAQFRNNLEVEVFTIFMEDYHCDSGWIAIAANHGDNDWRKLESLPDRVDAMAELAFAYRKPVDEEELAVYGALSAGTIVKRRFRPPDNWQSFRHVDDHTIDDVLGIVISHEGSDVSVVYTTFGLARMRASVDLGTWLQMRIREEPESTVFPNTSALTSKNFRVLRSEKIAPPMSTRVVRPREEDKVLLCGVVVDGYRCLENVYLGEIFDPKRHIPHPPNTVPNPKGYLVEFFVWLRSNGWRWEVIKYHCNAIDDIDFVPLQLSIFPNYEGRTCDDPHALLIDSTYVDVTECDASTASTSMVSAGGGDGSYRYMSLSSTNAQSSADRDVEKSVLRRTPSEIRIEMEDLKKAAMAPAHILLSRSVDAASVVEESNRYRAKVDGKRIRGMCLVTKKTNEFALAYSRKFKIVLIKPDVFPNVADYHELCQVGEWLSACFAEVVDESVTNPRKLQFDHIATPTVRKNTRAAPVTRMISGFVQTCIYCEFNDDTVKHVDAEPSLLMIETVLGGVLISDVLYRRNEFHNTKKLIWVTHIRAKHGCYWKYVQKDMLVNFDDKYNALKKVFKREDEEKYSRQKLIAQEEDLLDLNDTFEDVSSLNLLSAPLKPHELLASFGAKPRTAADLLLVGSTSSAPSTAFADAAAKMPMISELAVEELQLLKKRSAPTGRNVNEEGSQRTSSVDKLSDPSPLIKMKVNYHYGEAEDEVQRINKSGHSQADSLAASDPKQNGATEKYSAPELISAQNSIDTCSTLPFNGGRSQSDRLNEMMGKSAFLAESSVMNGWLKNSEIDRPDDIVQSSSDEADLHMLQEICTLKSENSDNDEEELSDDYDMSFDDGILRVIDSKGSE